MSKYLSNRQKNLKIGISSYTESQTVLEVTGNTLVTGVSTISANSSTDALRITQTGTGNALVVEDSTNPDSTPFVVTATGSVGIGTTNPEGTGSVSLSGIALAVRGTGFFKDIRIGNAHPNQFFQRISAEGNTGINFEAYGNYVGGFYSTDYPLGLQLRNTSALYWSNTTSAALAGNADLYLYRDSSGVLAQRNVGVGQTFRIYNTFTGVTTNFERANLGWNNNVFIVGTEKGSSIGTARQMEFQTDGTTRVAITTTGLVGVGTTNATQSLDVNGNVRVRGGIVDSNNQIGLAGSILISTGIGISWTTPEAGLSVQGSQGTTGSQGSQGTQGSLGVQGSQGTQGLQGVQGTQGGLGSQGSIGAQGVQGRIGAQGIQGSQGGLGSQGAQGGQGSIGVQGAQGTLGAQGVQGNTGSQGNQGVQGASGSQGGAGSQGIQGSQGTNGSQGSQGLQGGLGAQGLQGVQGGLSAQGAAGSQGSKQSCRCAHR